MRFASRKVVGVVVLAALISAASNGASVRRVRNPDSTRGGDDVCADKVINTTADCYLREVDFLATKIRCDGHNLDQDCQAATSDTSNVCSKNDATCSGAEEIFDLQTQQWVAYSTNCRHSQYKTAALKTGDCVPAK